MSIVYATKDKYSMKHAWRDSSGTWYNETIVGPLTIPIYYQTGAVGGDGTVHAVYSLGNPYYNIYYTYKRVGGGWVSPIALGVQGDNAEGVRMVVDPNGGIHCSWMPYLPYINYRYAASGKTLNDSVTETISGSSTVGNGGIAVTHSGTVHLSPHFSRKIWHTYKPVGGSFSVLTCATITEALGTGELFNAIGADESGKVYVSWSELLDGVNSVKLSVLQNKVWTIYTVDALAKVGGSDANNMPAIAITDQAGYLLWRHNDDHLYLGEYAFSYLKVAAPNGGESMSPGSIQEISWTSSNLTGDIRLELLKGQTVLGTIADNLNITYSPYLWTAGNYLDGAGAPKTAANASDYRIKLSTMDNANSDTSDAYFALANPSFSLTAPNGGESWVTGSSHNITWTSTGTITDVRIEYSSNNGADWTNVVASTPNDGSHSWTIPSAISSQCLVRVSDAANASVSDASNAVFSIISSLVPALTITAPASGALWQRGMTYAITWLKQGTQNANVKIYLYKGISTLVKTITITTPNDGAYNWLVPSSLPVGSTYFIRVMTIDNLIRDDSDKFSIIVPTIRVTAPTSGTVWTKGSTRTIAWIKTGSQNANVKIQLLKGTIVVSTLALTTSNDESFNWRIPATQPSSTKYKIRIITVDGLVRGTSGLFTITN
jgi:hypothetical protein